MVHTVPRVMVGVGVVVLVGVVGVVGVVIVVGVMVVVGVVVDVGVDKLVLKGVDIAESKNILRFDRVIIPTTKN